jgi:hypothetical protein
MHQLAFQIAALQLSLTVTTYRTLSANAQGPTLLQVHHILLACAIKSSSIATLGKLTKLTLDGPHNFSILMYNSCDSEERLCFGNSDLDPSIQSGIDQWHSICDGRIPFSPTTPAVSSITASFIPSNCLAAEAACASAAAGNSACSVSYAGKSQTESFSSCLCQPSILSQEYTCAFLGNMSCQQTSAALSNMAEYSFYSNLVSVVGGNNGTVSLISKR